MYFPLVSVIIPTYNSSETISECINSVLIQTYTNIEIVVIDDGSVDTTVDILSDFLVNNENRIILLSQKNSGPSVARNNGILHAKGDYIAFLDSDDAWYPEKIEKQVKLYLEYKDLILLGSLYSIGNKVFRTNVLPDIKEVYLTSLIFKNCFVTSTVMCPRIMFQNYNFNENQKYSEDYRLWLQLAASGKLCILQNKVLTKMNDKPLWGAKGLSSKLWLMEKGELSNLKFIYQNSSISLLFFLISSIFSICKYIKRILLYKLR